MVTAVRRHLVRMVGSLVREVQDFPKRGIVFQDLTPVLSDGPALSWCSEWLGDQVTKYRGDVVAGIEARGFVFGALAAEHASVGFVPVRKKNKLPHKVVRERYSLEYGEDVLEVHADSLEGKRVVIVDDVLATGGTAAAAARLVIRAGGKVAGFAFLLRIAALRGEKNLRHRWSSVLCR